MVKHENKKKRKKRNEEKSSRGESCRSMGPNKNKKRDKEVGPEVPPSQYLHGCKISGRILSCSTSTWTNGREGRISNATSARHAELSACSGTVNLPVQHGAKKRKTVRKRPQRKKSRQKRIVEATYMATESELYCHEELREEKEENGSSLSEWRTQSHQMARCRERIKELNLRDETRSCRLEELQHVPEIMDRSSLPARKRTSKQDSPASAFAFPGRSTASNSKRNAFGWGWQPKLRDRQNLSTPRKRSSQNHCIAASPTDNDAFNPLVLDQHVCRDQANHSHKDSVPPSCDALTPLPFGSLTSFIPSAGEGLCSPPPSLDRKSSFELEQDLFCPSPVSWPVLVHEEVLQELAEIEKTVTSSVGIGSTSCNSWAEVVGYDSYSCAALDHGKQEAYSVPVSSERKRAKHQVTGTNGGGGLSSETPSTTQRVVRCSDQHSCCSKCPQKSAKVAATPAPKETFFPDNLQNDEPVLSDSCLRQIFQSTYLTPVQPLSQGTEALSEDNDILKTSCLEGAEWFAGCEDLLLEHLAQAPYELDINESNSVVHLQEIDCVNPTPV